MRDTIIHIGTPTGAELEICTPGENVKITLYRPKIIDQESNTCPNNFFF